MTLQETFQHISFKVHSRQPERLKVQVEQITPIRLLSRRVGVIIIVRPQLVDEF